MVRLLPRSHPYMNPENIGKFGIRHVVAAAADNLVINRRNIDQIVIFAAVLLAVLLLLLQIILLVWSLIVQPVLAASVFDTLRPKEDIAFVLMDRVLGVPDLFCSLSNPAECSKVQSQIPLPFHLALHDLFKFYSLGMLIIGVLIFLYFVLVVVLETAVTGHPFGQRFQNAWVPIRLVMALGLLLPLAHGLNSAQYITLYAAKFGSGFATNAWTLFNNTIQASSGGIFGDGQNPTGEQNSLLALPATPDITPVVQFMSLVHGCAYAQWHRNTRDEGANAPMPPSNAFKYVRPYLMKNPAPWMNNTESWDVIDGLAYPYTQALDFYNNGDIVIVFGERIPELLPAQKGDIKPTCGSIRIRVGDLKHRGENIGPDRMQKYYFDIIKEMWFGYGGRNNLIDLSHRLVAVSMPLKAMKNGKLVQCTIACDNNLLPSCYASNPAHPDCEFVTPFGRIKQVVINEYQGPLQSQLIDTWDQYAHFVQDTKITQEILDFGWGGAGIWYNKINQINGTFINSVVDIPVPVKQPSAMEEVRAKRLASDSDAAGFNIFEPNLSNGEPVRLDGGADQEAIAKALNDYFQWWNEDGANQSRQDKVNTGQTFEYVMNLVFGTNALMAMRGQNAHIHPMAQLTALGKSLVDSAIRHVAGSTFASVMGGIPALNGRLFGIELSAAAGLLTSTAFIGLTAGFILFYILPFLPFVYFFFVVGEWVKTIFEAMVGLPLWALAHLRIDGEGLPGDSASNGYFLIFEIFLRPIVSIFGLIGSMTIFTVQVRILNFTWDLVIDNLTGFAEETDSTISLIQDVVIQRGVIDNFFFTIIYTMIVYMMATASFKLIDRIPDGILRWIGAGVPSFGSMPEDPTGSLTRYVAIGGMTLGQQAVDAIQTGARGVGGVLRSELGKLDNLGKGGTGPQQGGS